MQVQLSFFVPCVCGFGSLGLLLLYSACVYAYVEKGYNTKSHPLQQYCVKKKVPHSCFCFLIIEVVPDKKQ